MFDFSSSSFVWAEDGLPGRQIFVSFEKRFHLVDSADCAAPPCQLKLFADTRYRLWVNGHFVGYGPGRFVTPFPEYDSHELEPWLVAGENLIRVEVNYYGASSYQSMPDGRPGFIAAGGSADGRIDFSTPGDWRARVHNAWRSDAPLFSFAQNPVEICDTGLLEAELEDATRVTGLRVLQGDAAPWNWPTPRSVSSPDYQLLLPAELQLAAPLRQARTFGFQTLCEGSRKDNLPGSTRPWRQFATWLHAKTAEPLSVGCFWSELNLNGEAVAVDTATQLGNHGTALLNLREGWNLLEGRLEILADAWAYLLRLPEASGVRIHALPDSSCDAVFCLSPVLANRGEALPLIPDEATFGLPSGWTLDSGDVARVTPARLVAWDEPDDTAALRNGPFEALGETAHFHARAATWVFRYEVEFHGQPWIEVEAPSGTLLDVAYDDWARADGCANLYGSNPYTDSADRFILKGGRQVIDVFNPRGGIFLQITLRRPEGLEAAALKLHAIGVRRRTLVPAESMTGTLTTGNATFDYAWQVALNTLEASTDEAYTDCPWRERGSYIGDAVVTACLHRRVSTDMAVPRRTFLNFGRAALPDGQLACCAPSWLRKPHEDFTCLWILGVEQLVAWTGNVACIEENWFALEGIWTSPWETHTSGLWNGDGRRIFLDWGVQQTDRIGEANAAINILRVAALRASSRLARLLQRAERAAAFLAEAERVEATLIEHLWDEAEGRFRPSLTHSGPALHANVLALRFGLGNPHRLLDYLKPRLRRNFQQGIREGQWSGHLELYFLSFLLPALGELGEVDLAEDLIDEHYGFLQSLGHTTLAECFCRADRSQGSRCHTWSAAGAIYAHEYILGLRQADGDDPDHWLLDPRASDRFPQVSGTLPHARGLIRVSWRRQGDCYLADVEAPEGVVIEAGENVRLSLCSASV